MSLKPYADAQASIGDVIKDAHEYAWIGDGTCILHNVRYHGALMQFIFCARDEAAVASDRWHRTVSADEIKQLVIRERPRRHIRISWLQLSYGNAPVNTSGYLSCSWSICKNKSVGRNNHVIPITFPISQVLYRTKGIRTLIRTLHNSCINNSEDSL